MTVELNGKSKKFPVWNYSHYTKCDLDDCKRCYTVIDYRMESRDKRLNS